MIASTTSGSGKLRDVFAIPSKSPTKQQMSNCEVLCNPFSQFKNTPPWNCTTLPQL